MIVVTVLIGIDLRASSVRGGAVTAKGAAMWVGLWVAASLAFAGYLHHRFGARASAPFLTAWVLEYALSVDNLFVFVLIFNYFKVRPDAQHRLLYWGVMGAFVLRAGLIGAGAVAVAQFHWLLYAFGVLGRAGDIRVPQVRAGWAPSASGPGANPTNQT